MLQDMFDKARKLGSNNACAWYSQLLSEAKPPQEQEVQEAARACWRFMTNGPCPS